MDPHRLLQKALSSPASLRFDEARALVRAFGFHLSRISGSHHMFRRPGLRVLVNLQDRNGMAKAYQIRQLLNIVERCRLTIGEKK